MKKALYKIYKDLFIPSIPWRTNLPIVGVESFKTKKAAQETVDYFKSKKAELM